jgi:hypothetical protein
MRRIVILSLLFGLNSCLVLWNEATEKEEPQSNTVQALAIAAALPVTPPEALPETASPVACTAPTGSVYIETIVPAQGGNLMFQVSGSVSTATHYLFYGRSTQSPDWTLFTSIPAADFDSSGGLIYVPNPGLDDYMIRAASDGCVGPDSNIFSPMA